MTLTLSHNNGVDPRALDDDRLMQQAKEQSEVEYLKGALNTQVVNREEQIRALNEIEKAQTERRHKLLQNITDRGQRYEPISGFPGQPSNQQPHPQHSSGEQISTISLMHALYFITTRGALFPLNLLCFIEHSPLCLGFYIHVQSVGLLNHLYISNV